MNEHTSDLNSNVTSGSIVGIISEGVPHGEVAIDDDIWVEVHGLHRHGETVSCGTGIICSQGDGKAATTATRSRELLDGDGLIT